MDDTLTTIAVVVVLIFVGMLIAGATNKIVIYFNAGDFVISFMPWVSLFIGSLLVDLYQHQGEVDMNALSGAQTFFWNSCLLMAAIFFIWSMKLSITHNRSIVLGLFVGIFKILVAWIGVFLVVALIGDIKKQSSIKNALGTVFLLGFFIWLGKQLINGRRVYQAKGWALPGEDSNAQ